MSQNSLPKSRRNSKSSPSHRSVGGQDAENQEEIPATEDEQATSYPSCKTSPRPEGESPRGQTPILRSEAASRRTSPARSVRSFQPSSGGQFNEEEITGSPHGSSQSPKQPSECPSRRSSPPRSPKSQNFSTMGQFNEEENLGISPHGHSHSSKQPSECPSRRSSPPRSPKSQNFSTMGQFNEEENLGGSPYGYSQSSKQPSESPSRRSSPPKSLKSQNMISTGQCNALEGSMMEDIGMNYDVIGERSDMAGVKSLGRKCPSTCRGIMNEVSAPAVRGSGCCRNRIPAAEGCKSGTSAPLRPCPQGKPKFYNQQGTRTPNFERSSRPVGHEAHMKSPQPSVPQDPHHHHHHHHHPESLQEVIQPDQKTTSALSHLTQLRRTPSYSLCGINQDLEFMDTCCLSRRGKEKITNLPPKVCLRQEDIEQLIKCEAQDVDSAWFLTGDDRKSYKKPCPKQQKAQMTVKALVQAHASQPCSKEYSPLEHPDPEDISPDVAAAMMFSQERGIKMVECPNETIRSLFPEEQKIPFPEKSSISVVDRSSKDNEEMIEKTSIVVSEGVSDSAYTRKMKDKGEGLGAQKSFDVDFAIGQSKREYVLVAQKPQRVNKVQYRGGSAPSWFPGYLSAFPDEAGLKIVSSPSKIFHKAWIHSNPRNIPTNDVIVLD